MTPNIEFPQGEIIKSTTTRIDDLSELIQQYMEQELQGYLSLYFYKYGEYYEGFLVLLKGKVILAVANFDRIYRGREAVNHIMDEAEKNICNIDIHSYKKIYPLIKEYPSAIIEDFNVEDIMRSSEERAWISLEREEFRQKLETFKDRGYNVSKLETVMEGEIGKVRTTFEQYEHDLNTLDELKARLDDIDTSNYPKERRYIKALLRDPDNITTAKKEIIALEERSRERAVKKKATHIDAKGKHTYKDLLSYWERLGYNTSRIEKAMATKDAAVIKVEFKLYEKDVNSLQRLEAMLDQIKTKRHRAEKRALKMMMNDPENISTLKESIYQLGVKVAEEEKGGAEGSSRTTAKKVKGGPKAKAIEPKARSTKQGKTQKRTKTSSTARTTTTTTTTKTARTTRTGHSARPDERPSIIDRPATKTTTSTSTRSVQGGKKVGRKRVQGVLRSIEFGKDGSPSISPSIFGTSPEEEVEEPMVEEPPERTAPKVPAHLIKFTFDNFIVDESNRFAQVSALGVARSPGTTYNPLFLYSKSGLGKTHLLGAIYNYVLEEHPEIKVRYVTSQRFTEDIIESLQDPEFDVMRKYMDVDMLLLDDVQGIAGREGVQERFFNIFNHLHTRGNQIVLTSDRPPKDLASLEERLRTRFEGGLIADMQKPTFELRAAILIKKAAANNIFLPAEVISFIASTITSSIRELEGALTRITAEQMLHDRPITVERAQELLRDYLKDVDIASIEPVYSDTPEPSTPEEEPEPEPPVPTPPPMPEAPPDDGLSPPPMPDMPAEEPSIEAPTPIPEPVPDITPPAAVQTPTPAFEVPAHEIDPSEPYSDLGLELGFGYIFRENQPEVSYKVFSEVASRGGEHICISRVNPKHLLKKWPNLSNTKLLWLTDHATRTDIVSSRLEIIIDHLTNQIRRGNSVLLLDGLEYLVHINGFPSVLAFIRRLKDEISEYNSILIVPFNPNAIGSQDAASLERELEVYG